MTTSTTPGRAIVVGGGIAGLSAAFRLRQAGFDVKVLERADRVGGRMHTVDQGGYRIDAAASVLPTTYRHTLRLIADAGLSGLTQPTCDVMGIARPERVHHLHSRKRTDLLRTKLLGPRSKLKLAKVLADLHRHRAALNQPFTEALGRLDTETIADYASRALTVEAMDYFVQPLTGDFYLTPPEELSVVNLFLLLKTMIGADFINSDQGVRFLPEGLARQVSVETSAAVTSVEEHATGVTVTWDRPGSAERTESADVVVVAVPATEAPGLLPQFSDEQRGYLATVPYARSLVVTLTLTKPPVEQAMWLTVPDRTHPDVNVVILDHNKAPGRVPPGAAMVTIYWHRHWADKYWDTDDDQLLSRAIAATHEVLPGVENTVVDGYVWRWDPCTVARPVGGFRDLAEFTAGLDPDSRVQLAGDYFAITTVDNSVASGERAARRLITRHSNPSTAR
ncbi:protoporphyrinogen/coproporphyrinogen oxidase [Embleya scabrispora]|uniref:protoporphyrinogen/coproporphyrinogen oxidase n=1 Tax=Embleya scabrispora TaxID=159449 RepID=UPI00039B88B3|nr:FAD-dependent oxidoreductase [Embleya scabrispora]MYS79272.1 FAD-dependent oxidoreductase [Streptomyces sp. SID5474]